MKPAATPVPRVLDLFGADDHTTVRRALAEARSGRAVIVTADETATAVLPVEWVDGEALAQLRRIATGPLGLALSGPRLAALGAGPADAVADVGPLDAAALEALARGRVEGIVPPALHPADIVALAALTLMRQAQLLPAALLAPLGAGSPPPSALRVRAADVRADRESPQEVRLVSRAPVPLFLARDAEFVVFRGGDGFREQLAVVVGRPDVTRPVPVRLHSACLTGDLFGSLRCDCGDQLREAVRRFAEEADGGVLLYLDQEGRGTGIASKIAAYRLQSEGQDTFEADALLGYGTDARRFGFAASMLRQLGIGRVRLLTNNPEKARALAEAGVKVVGTERVFGRVTPANRRYLEAKRERAGHLLPPATDGLQAAE